MDIQKVEVVMDMEPLFILISAYIVMICAFFSLVYFWIYPDSWIRGQNPKHWALTGGVLISIFQFVGFFIWIVLYMNGRKKGPGFSYFNSKPIFSNSYHYKPPIRRY
jgi:hypothetical protein